MILDNPSQNIIKNGVDIGECDTIVQLFNVALLKKNLEKFKVYVGKNMFFILENVDMYNTCLYIHFFNDFLDI